MSNQTRAGYGANAYPARLMLSRKPKGNNGLAHAPSVNKRRCEHHQDILRLLGNASWDPRDCFLGIG